MVEKDFHKGEKGHHLILRGTAGPGDCLSIRRYIGSENSHGFPRDHWFLQPFLHIIPHAWLKVSCSRTMGSPEIAFARQILSGGSHVGHTLWTFSVVWSTCRRLKIAEVSALGPFCRVYLIGRNPSTFSG